jgi:hypothetical protein
MNQLQDISAVCLNLKMVRETRRGCLHDFDGTFVSRKVLHVFSAGYQVQYCPTAIVLHVFIVRTIKHGGKRGTDSSERSDLIAHEV